MRGKCLVIIMTLLGAVSASAFECKFNEAQFIGTIAETRNEWIDQGVVDCFIRIDFSYFGSSKICPMDEMQARHDEIYAYDNMCDGVYNVGDPISGYLLQDKDGRIYLDRSASH